MTSSTTSIATQSETPSETQAETQAETDPRTRRPRILNRPSVLDRSTLLRRLARAGGVSRGAASADDADDDAADDDDLVVRIAGGALRGLRHDLKPHDPTPHDPTPHGRQLRSWRGIPYAAAPVSDLRFRAPAPVVPWEGVRDATAFGPIAPQPVRRRSAATGPALIPVDENCLTANVQTPLTAAEVAEGARLPVMVFIHGGGYSAGSSRDFSGQGEAFTRTGRVVFVSFNYRLGPFGYLDFTPYSTPERPIESNLGLRDQVALLTWVQQNIAAFGGDPSNVTVFGESAGAGSVTTLLGVPAARGLFARAIAQSPPSSAVFRAELAQEWSATYLEILRRRASDGAWGTETSDAVSLLLSADSADLVAASQELQRTTPDTHPGAFCLAPVVDGDYLPEHPMRAVREGRGLDVPLIIGTNSREGGVFRGPLDILPSTEPRIRSMFNRAPRASRRPLNEVYRGLPKRHDGLDFGGDYAFWYPSTLLADWSSRRSTTHAYRFDVAPRLLHLTGLEAIHSLELYALFDRLDLPLARAMTALGGREAFASVGHRMRGAWLQFATDGTVPALWPAYDEVTRKTLIIDETARVEADPRRATRIAWKAFLPIFETLW